MKKRTQDPDERDLRRYEIRDWAKTLGVCVLLVGETALLIEVWRYLHALGRAVGVAP